MGRRQWGSVYPRSGWLWIAYVDELGVRQQQGGRDKLGLTVGQEDKARALLETIRRRVVAAKKAGVSVETGPMTFSRYLERWSVDREKRGLSNAKNDRRRLEIYAAPTLGSLRLADITADHVEDVMRALNQKMGAGKGQLSYRLVRDVKGLLHTLFADAIRERLATAQPCAGIRKDLIPRKRDKDNKWRSTAWYSREEVEALISDERIPEDRRTLYTLLFLTGMRIGEASARRWRDYDAEVKPLGRLFVATSFNRKMGREKSVKTDVPREVPVHPTLAKTLAAWKLGGWQKLMGRPAREDDLLIPSGFKDTLRDNVALKSLHRDLNTLGLRVRSLHNMRRTFISLARTAGVVKDHLRPITHGGAERDQLDDYTTLPWETFCAAVLRLEISHLEGRLLSLPVAVGQLHPALQSKKDEENKMVTIGRRGTRTLPISVSPRHFEAPSDIFQSGDIRKSSKAQHPAAKDCSAVAEGLKTALSDWLRAPDPERLRTRLQALLSTLGGSDRE